MRIGISRLAAVLGGFMVSIGAGFGAAWAQPMVTLTSLDGATQIEGELLDFDGAAYTVLTAFGSVAVDAAQVTCAGQGCPGSLPGGGAFAIEGSNIIGDGLIPALAQGYADAIGAELVREVGGGQHLRVFRLIGGDGEEVVAISVSALGTATAFPALAENAAVLGLASRRMSGAQGGLPDLRGGPDEHILALGAVVVIVHPDNPVRALSLDRIAAIFAGRITSWAELGGPPLPIVLYAPDRRSGTRDLFETLVMQPRGLAIAGTAETLEGHADLSDLVAIDPAGIGVTGFAYARASRMLAIRRSCGLVAAPTSFAIKTGEYPLSRRLYAYGSGDPLAPHPKAFLEFALSDAAQPAIADAGFASRGIERLGLGVQGARLAHGLTSAGEFSLELFRDMLGEFKDAERLSLTFRFAAGSGELEPRSQSEAGRFARLLAAGAYAGKDILLVGFTDSEGDFDVNRDLAASQARSVLDTIAAAVPEGALDAVPLQAQGYGELTPVSCNETPAGRALNRRVEVWVRDRRG